MQRKDTINIRTGADTIDAILGGGVPTRSLTEIYGEWRYVQIRPTPSPNTAEHCVMFPPAGKNTAVHACHTLGKASAH